MAPLHCCSILSAETHLLLFSHSITTKTTNVSINYDILIQEAPFLQARQQAV